jgi:hypothetical protein
MTTKQAFVFHISYFMCISYFIPNHIKLNEVLLIHFQNEFLLRSKRKKRPFYRTIGMTQFDVDPVNISA